MVQDLSIFLEHLQLHLQALSRMQLCNFIQIHQYFLHFVILFSFKESIEYFHLELMATLYLISQLNSLFQNQHITFQLLLISKDFISIQKSFINLMPIRLIFQNIFSQNHNCHQVQSYLKLILKVVHQNFQIPILPFFIQLEYCFMFTNCYFL